jgi:hypothetical protein
MPSGLAHPPTRPLARPPPRAARFLEEVKNDPWGASHCHSQADRLEELQEGAAGPGADLEALEGDGASGLGAGMLTTVDDKSSAVVVVNSVGIIQMANKVGGCQPASGGWLSHGGAVCVWHAPATYMPAP